MHFKTIIQRWLRMMVAFQQNSIRHHIICMPVLLRDPREKCRVNLFPMVPKQSCKCQEIDHYDPPILDCLHEKKIRLAYLEFKVFNGASMQDLQLFREDEIPLAQTHHLNREACNNLFTQRIDFFFYSKKSFLFSGFKITLNINALQMKEKVI